jgi:CRP-like cAMP-binding protein
MEKRDDFLLKPVLFSFNTDRRSNVMEKNKNRRPDIEAYKDFQLFQTIEEDQMQDLMNCLNGHVRRYHKGHFILFDGENVYHVGIVISGTVHMMKEDIWGDQTLVTYMSRGELFGESFALRKENNSYVTFVSATDAEILFLDLRHILTPCKNNCAFHQRLTKNMFDLLGRKNIQLMEKIEILSKNTLREKILAFLSMQAQRQESKYISLTLSRAEMAKYLCINRSAMIRELSTMREEGIIDFDKNTFIIL